MAASEGHSKAAIELIHSHESPLWNELIRRLKGRTVHKITVIAPFYDQELGFLKLLHELWPAAVLTVVAQQDYASNVAGSSRNDDRC
jgi:hypothetical protein